MKNIWGIAALSLLLIACGSGKSPVRIVEDKTALIKVCQQTPDIVGCEKYRGTIKNIHSSMIDHSAVITSEEAFIVNMIPHHQEAVDTARLIVTKSENTELKRLAQEIITTQEKEITMMKKWLYDWGYSTITPSYVNMMGDGTMLSGKSLDKWFLQGMIEHHTGAVEMAEAILRLHSHAETADFSRDIIKNQTKEIIQMRSMLNIKVVK